MGERDVHVDFRSPIASSEDAYTHHKEQIRQDNPTDGDFQDLQLPTAEKKDGEHKLGDISVSVSQEQRLGQDTTTKEKGKKKKAKGGVITVCSCTTSLLQMVLFDGPGPLTG